MKRYDIYVGNFEDLEVEENSNGEWVKYEDVEVELRLKWQDGYISGGNDVAETHFDSFGGH